MKKWGILAVFMLAGCATGNGFLAKPGLPIFSNKDLVQAHVILQAGTESGASVHIKHADNCVVAFLAHPELQSGVPTPNVPEVKFIDIPPTAGPISSAAATAVKIDLDKVALKNKIALVEAGLPDDIVTGCALLVHDLSAPGILKAMNEFLHPTNGSK